MGISEPNEPPPLESVPVNIVMHCIISTAVVGFEVNIYLFMTANILAYLANQPLWLQLRH